MPFRQLPNNSICIFFGNILLNLILHLESYISNKKINRPQPSVFTIAIVEVVFTIVMFYYSLQLYQSGTVSFWTELMVIFSCYLVFNGASLMAIPIGFAMFSGISAILTAVLVFSTANDWGTLSAICLGISFIVNGIERIVMAQLARIVKRKLEECND